MPFKLLFERTLGGVLLIRIVHGLLGIFDNLNLSGVGILIVISLSIVGLKISVILCLGFCL